MLLGTLFLLSLVVLIRVMFVKEKNVMLVMVVLLMIGELSGIAVAYQV